MSRLFALLSNRQAAIKERGMRHIQAFPQDYEELVSLAFGDTQPQSWYAAYILGGILEQDPQKVEEFYAKVPQIINALPHFSSPGQKRDFLKILLKLPIPEEEMGSLINICFDFMLNPKSDVSFIVYSMQHIYNCSLRFGELQQELLLAMEEIEKYATPGIKNKIGKLRKLMK